MGPEGEVIRSPFNDLPPQNWPWDFTQVLNTRRHMDLIDREISFKDEFPQPTKRTRNSDIGMKEWREWVKEQEEKKRKHDPNKPEPKQKWQIHTPAHTVVFDYKSSEYIRFEENLSGRLSTFEEIMNIDAKKNNPASGRRRS
jgi:hypothetical protein